MNKVAIAVVFIFATIAIAQQHSAQRHWQSTERETLWRGRYSNCQYGYYLLLPVDTVAHAEHPPNPHHGFVINLPDVGLTTEASVYNSERFVWVNAEYSVTDESTFAGSADHRRDLTSKDQQNFKLDIERHKTALRSVPATRFKAEYDTPRGRVIEERVVALRSGIVYEVGLRTPTADYAADRERLEQILTGFRFSRVPNGRCWNH